MVPAARRTKKESFIHGETPIPYAARTFEEDEVVAAVSSTLDFWLNLGGRRRNYGTLSCRVPRGQAFFTG